MKQVLELSTIRIVVAWPLGTRSRSRTAFGKKYEEIRSRISVKVDWVSVTSLFRGIDRSANLVLESVSRKLFYRF